MSGSLMRIKKNLATAAILCIIALVLISFPAKHYVNASDPDSADCTDCHTKTMERHRFPAASCTTCHSADMSTLILRDGKKIPIEQSSTLCGQCHKDVYQAWEDGKHGVAGSSCVECHDPHTGNQPLVASSSNPSLLPMALQALTAVGVLMGASLTAIVVTTRLREVAK